MKYPISIKVGTRIQISIPSMEIWQKNRNFSNQDGGRRPYWKSFFWLYLGAILADQREIWNKDVWPHADIGHVTKTAIFENSRWRTAAILKIALFPYLSRELSDFDQIWQADVHFNSHDGYLRKIEIFQIKDGGRTPYWKSFFGYISASYWPINAKFGIEMKDHMSI